MGSSSVSVIVVSRDRPDALARCLDGLAQQFHHPFEVIVVTDPAGCAAAARHALAPYLKVVPFDRPNISAARNRGIARAGGEILAFIDDDAVPEPTWLAHLSAPFADPGIAAAGGYVLGRNGISFQWRARTVNRAGVAQDLRLQGEAPVVADIPADGAVKTEGTNMALRSAVARELGGFDEAFTFYLDETDLNMRLARARLRTAIVPLARVHHGFAASPRRRADRLPTTLFEIGASSAVFWAKHLPADGHANARAALIDDQRRRLLRHMVRGTAEPGDVGRLLATLDRGLAEGERRAADQYPARGPADDFRPLPPELAPQGSTYLVGGPGTAARLHRQASRLRDQGQVVTVLRLSHSALYHHIRFDEAGIWVQTGGIHGRSDRNQPLLSLTTRGARARREIARCAACRGLVGVGSQA